MRTKCIGVLLAGLATLLPLQPARATMTWTFDTIPASGDITGAPGEVVGWGYLITNEDPDNSLELTGVSADLFAFAAPDASVFDFPLLAPLATLSVPYLGGFPALYEATVNLGAPPGSVDSGIFTLTADWYDALGDLVVAGDSRTAPYSLTVTAPTLVPEPSSWLVLISALAVLAIIGPLNLSSPGGRMSFLAERRTGMFRMIRLALVFIAAATLPLLAAAGEAMAGGGLLPTVPPGWVLNSSHVTAQIALDPNGPVNPVYGPPVTPTGTFGAITIENNNNRGTATAVFKVQQDSTLGELAFGCDLSWTNSRFVQFAEGQPGLPLGGPGTVTNWLPTDTTVQLFSQVGVTLVDQSGTVLMIPGVTEVISQQCAPFPASYPAVANPGFLILEVKLGFWAAPKTKTPN